MTRRRTIFVSPFLCGHGAAGGENIWRASTGVAPPLSWQRSAWRAGVAEMRRAIVILPAGMNSGVNVVSGVALARLVSCLFLFNSGMVGCSGCRLAITINSCVWRVTQHRQRYRLCSLGAPVSLCVCMIWAAKISVGVCRREDLPVAYGRHQCRERNGRTRGAGKLMAAMLAGAVA